MFKKIKCDTCGEAFGLDGCAGGFFDTNQDVELCRRCLVEALPPEVLADLDAGKNSCSEWSSFDLRV